MNKRLTPCSLIVVSLLHVCLAHVDRALNISLRHTSAVSTHIGPEYAGGFDKLTNLVVIIAMNDAPHRAPPIASIVIKETGEECPRNVGVFDTHLPRMLYDGKSQNAESRIFIARKHVIESRSHPQLPLQPNDHPLDLLPELSQLQRPPPELLVEHRDGPFCANSLRVQFLEVSSRSL